MLEVISNTLESLSPYLMWIIILLVSIIVETITLGLTTIWFAFGALLALIVTALGANIAIQMFIFIIVSLCLLYFTRPIAKKVLKIGHTKTNYETFIDKVGIVTQEINNLKATGQVKVQGQTWTAISYNNDVIGLNSKVTIKDIKGVKVVVKKIK